MTPRVVVIDDDEDFRYLLGIAARRRGVEVVGEAGTAEQGAALVRMTQPDAVILDNLMPGLSGVDAIPVLKLASPRTVIVMYTSDPNPAVRVEALRRDASSVLNKLLMPPGAVIDVVIDLTEPIDLTDE